MFQAVPLPRDWIGSRWHYKLWSQTDLPSHLAHNLRAVFPHAVGLRQLSCKSGEIATPSLLGLLWEWSEIIRISWVINNRCSLIVAYVPYYNYWYIYLLESCIIQNKSIFFQRGLDGKRRIIIIFLFLFFNRFYFLEWSWVHSKIEYEVPEVPTYSQSPQIHIYQHWYYLFFTWGVEQGK